MFPLVTDEWIDLSTGINPIPYAIGEILPTAWTRLPEPPAIAALETAAASAYGVQGHRHAVAAPGTQALIQWLPRLVAATRVAVLGVTYAEHERVWRRAGAEVTVCTDVSALADACVAIVVNPNNPDGRLIPVAELLALADALARRGGTLVIDEAFMDVMAPGASLAPHLPRGRTIVLRSFGKAYGLAGLRLGFALAGRGFCDELRSALGPWAISGPAIEIGTRALADRDWLATTSARLSADAARLDDLLQRAGFRILGGTPLFRLAGHGQAAHWFERLGQAGILVRPFPSQPDRLRFGIPNGAAHWRRLQQALAQQL